ncbi:glycosyltransferase family 8 protein [Catalinimonas sp. 4WD22]|uniref:glycosyltransferase family 8 protein n=1 Tax=Catalinimonas locisalis TaxID=3133978 RepID=UPI0031018493
MKENIHIACAGDERYFPGLLATLSSILINTRYQEGISFHIIDGGIRQESWQILDRTLQRLCNVEILSYPIDQSDFEGFPDFFYDSKMAYARLLLPNLLPIDKVIYVDIDILFLKDIKLLWEMDFQGNAAMAALEAVMPCLKDDCPIIEQLKLDPNGPYFNSGLMYLNLDKFRKEDIANKTMLYLQTYPKCCKFWDQSALNVTLHKNFTLLDQSWNTQSHRKVFKIEEQLDILAEFDINYHFVTSFKPWLRYNDSPQNRLFYALLEEVGYTLTDPAFLFSKKTYGQKLKIGKLLPFLYHLRRVIKMVSGQIKEAEADKNTANFWQEQQSILRFQKNNKLIIDNMEAKWRKKVKEALSGQTVKV